MPVEPPPNEWLLPRPTRPLLGDVVGVGADLAPGTLLAAYRAGLFPMRLEGLGGPLAWWSPDPRGVLPLDGLVVSRSLRQSCRRFEVRVDTAVEEVVDGCADPAREGGWIGPDVRDAYLELHRLGWMHTVEAWAGERLAGGLYGVAVGGLFAGESMFRVGRPWARDASKVALVALVGLLRDAGWPGERLLDVQWPTPHLATLGVRAVRRRVYLRALRRALELPLPGAFDDGR